MVRRGEYIRLRRFAATAGQARAIMSGVRARFYAPEAHSVGALVSLPGDEAEHASRVLRLRRGEAVVVFNGRGQAFEAEIESVRRDQVHVRIGSPVAAAAEAHTAITLVQAVLKGDGMDDVVRDAVMIGVAAIQPIVTSRSEVSQAALVRSRRRERWQRIAVSSAKQCGRAVVPLVLELEAFDTLMARWEAERADRLVVMFVEPGVSPPTVSLTTLGAGLADRRPREAALLIGPEGGWTFEEVAAAEKKGCRLVTLGGRTLRAAAMALVAITALFVASGEYD